MGSTCQQLWQLTNYKNLIMYSLWKKVFYPWYIFWPRSSTFGSPIHKSESERNCPGAYQKQDLCTETTSPFSSIPVEHKAIHNLLLVRFKTPRFALRSFWNGSGSRSSVSGECSNEYLQYFHIGTLLFNVNNIRLQRQDSSQRRWGEVT